MMVFSCPFSKAGFPRKGQPAHRNASPYDEQNKRGRRGGGAKVNEDRRTYTYSPPPWRSSETKNNPAPQGGRWVSAGMQHTIQSEPARGRPSSHHTRVAKATKGTSRLAETLTTRIRFHTEHLSTPRCANTDIRTKPSDAGIDTVRTWNLDMLDTCSERNVPRQYPHKAASPLTHLGAVAAGGREGIVYVPYGYYGPAAVAVRLAVHFHLGAAAGAALARPPFGGAAAAVLQKEGLLTEFIGRKSIIHRRGGRELIDWPM